MQEFTIDIDERGDVRVEGHGIDGADCAKLTKELETALGETTKQVKKPEFMRSRAVQRKTGR